MKYDIEPSAEVFRIYAEIETELILNIASFFESNAEDIGSQAWRLQKLKELGRLNTKNVRTIAAHSGVTEAAVKTEIDAAGFKIVKNNVELLNNTVSVGNMRTVKNITEAFTKTTLAGLNLTNTRALQASNVEFLKVLNNVTVKTAAGFSTPQAALKQSVKQLAGNGITWVDYVNDKGVATRTSLESSVRRDIQTTIGKVAQEVQWAKGEEWGLDLIEISSHAGARPLCAEYQGQIFSKSGKHPRYKALSDTSYGEPAGLFGINCRHIFYLYDEGVSRKAYNPIDSDYNDKIYRESQQQRYLEREIRKWKREELALKETGLDATFETGKVKEKQAQMREFIKTTGRTREYAREQVYTSGTSAR